MNVTRCLFACFLVLTIFSSDSALAKMGYRQGVVSNRQLPAPVISKKIVRLNVPHIRQKKDLCVPTSSAMILKYFGESYDPAALKKIAEGHKPKSKRNKTFTYWVDMRHALRKVGKTWRIRDYRKTSSGFKSGLTDIKKSLRKKRPVMIDVHLAAGHTFVIMGYNDIEKVIYIRDPDISGGNSRVISYKELEASWHNHRFGNSRSAFFSRR